MRKTLKHNTLHNNTLHHNRYKTITNNSNVSIPSVNDTHNDNKNLVTSEVNDEQTYMHFKQLLNNTL